MCNILLSEEFVNGTVHTQLVSEPAFLQRMTVVHEQHDVQHALLAGVAVLLHGHKQEKLARQGAIQTVVARRWKDQQWR